ncbi:hypothetical protein [Modestobacter roseus]|uniref:hypothetical protein n=1 Tax=Modestobacter roseus TaxID=1181884 RepID=UPI001295BBFA|nr:hypothetical protein [Modestobacter roseus]MQA35977.1 hypothetical protein [Modestobacter roseus]
MSEPVRVQVGRVCPSCGREESIPLLWGMPGPEDFELADRELVALGGCMLGPDEPTLACRACGMQWGSDEDVEDGGLPG